MSSSHKQKVKKEYKRKLTIEAFKQSDCYTKITIKNKDGIELKAKEREEHDDYKLFMLRQKHIYKDIMDELDAYYAKSSNDNANEIQGNNANDHVAMGTASARGRKKASQRKSTASKSSPPQVSRRRGRKRKNSTQIQLDFGDESEGDCTTSMRKRRRLNGNSPAKQRS
eukprot:490027_1